MARIQSSRLPSLEEIEEDDPNVVDADGVLVEEEEGLNPTDRDLLVRWIGQKNIADDLDETTLTHLGNLVVDEYELDNNSRAEWKDKAQKALDFATQKAEPKQYPWPEASNIIFPLITTAAFQFAARAYPAILPGSDVVKSKIWGTDVGTPVTQDGSVDGAPVLNNQGQPMWLIPPGAKKRSGDRVAEHMSYQLLEEMEEWEPQTDSMLHQMPIVGGAVRKTFRDDVTGQTQSLFVPLLNLVWDKGAPSFARAPRHTEEIDLYPHEIQTLERKGAFRPIVYGPGSPTEGSNSEDQPTSGSTDGSAPHRFLEQHRRYDLDGDGYPEPCIATVHQATGAVVRVVARYDEDGIEMDGDTLVKIAAIDQYTLYSFMPDPEGGSYPLGFGHLLKPLNEGINTTLNQMFDAGHLQIAGGGFIAQGLSLHAGSNYFSIGEYKPVNARGVSVRDSIMPIPWPGPSPVLFQLLGSLISAGKEVASIQDILTGDASLANTPPTTMVALVEQGMKVYTAIYKRVYRSLKHEFAKIFRLNRLYLTKPLRFTRGNNPCEVSPADYRIAGVEPMADPKMVTDMQRITRAAMVIDRADKNPLVNKLEAERYLFEAAGITDVDRFLPKQMPQMPPSPEQIEAQVKMAKAQLEEQALQSKVGLERAQALQAYTTAMLNFQKAKASLSQPQLDFLEKQLDLLRLHIEALNTTVKAADVDQRHRATTLQHHAALVGHAVTHHGNLADTSQRARELANEQPQPRPADAGGDQPSPADVFQSFPAPNGGNGVQPVATPPGNPSSVPVSGPPAPVGNQ